VSRIFADHGIEVHSVKLGEAKISYDPDIINDD